MSDGDGKPTRSAAQDAAEERALSARLNELDRRLEKNRAAEAADRAANQSGPPRQGYGMALRLGADFVAGVAVGAAIGWGIDRLFGTSPWALIVCLMFGFAAGVLSVMRTAGMIPPGPTGPDDKV